MINLSYYKSCSPTSDLTASEDLFLRDDQTAALQQRILSPSKCLLQPPYICSQSEPYICSQSEDLLTLQHFLTLSEEDLLPASSPQQPNQRPYLQLIWSPSECQPHLAALHKSLSFSKLISSFPFVINPLSQCFCLFIY
jgi:hypothetical protein